MNGRQLGQGTLSTCDILGLRTLNNTCTPMHGHGLHQCMGMDHPSPTTCGLQSSIFRAIVDMIHRWSRNTLAYLVRIYSRNLLVVQTVALRTTLTPTQSQTLSESEPSHSTSPSLIVQRHLPRHEGRDGAQLLAEPRRSHQTAQPALQPRAKPRARRRPAPPKACRRRARRRAPVGRARSPRHRHPHDEPVGPARHPDPAKRRG